MKIAINGFGRIGKTFLRTILQNNTASKLEVTTINIGPAQKDLVALHFKYDSIMGKYPEDVSFNNDVLTVGNHKIKVIAECDPSKVDWKGIDWVVESTGCFTSKEASSMHLSSGAKNVLISAPCGDADHTIIPGINDDDYDPSAHKIVSLGSCTTNCFVPVVKVLKDAFGMQKCFMTTIHSYTNDQVLLDIEHSDPRRARAAALNIIPTRTGAQKVITQLYPELEGKVFASAIRVPTAVVSLIDLTFEGDREVTEKEINKAFSSAASDTLKGILGYTEEPLVSSDYKGNPLSCVVDGLLTKATGNMGKVFGWYDNEWGYSQRLKDFLLHNS